MKNEFKNTHNLGTTLICIGLILLIITTILVGNKLWNQMQDNQTLLTNIENSNKDINDTVTNINNNMLTAEEITQAKQEIINKINSIDVRSLINEKYNSLLKSQQTIINNQNNSDKTIEAIEKLLNEIKNDIANLDSNETISNDTTIGN